MPLAAPISIVASIVLLSGFALLNLEKLTSDHYTYQWLNAIGAAALTYSAIKPFNVGVVITEAIWILIALFGVAKIWYKSRQSAKKSVV